MRITLPRPAAGAVRPNAHALPRVHKRDALAKSKKGAPKKITPALERIPQREPDSSDEEEERALLLGGQGK